MKQIKKMVSTQTLLLLALLLTPISVLAQELEKIQKLEEVIVTSKIPYIKLKGGAIAFNPQLIIQKRAINNALDLLRYASGGGRWCCDSCHKASWLQ